jgi:hypothetical protein
VHRLGACIGIPIMAGAAGIADIWRQRSGRGQDLTLDLRKGIHGINPMYKFMPTINGYPTHAISLQRTDFGAVLRGQFEPAGRLGSCRCRGEQRRPP